MPLLNVGDHPLPKRKWLGVRVVDAENLDSVADPKEHDVAQFAPQGAGVGTVPVEIDDVLIFLGRVLGVLDRSVGSKREPLGMLFDVGMVGRTLQSVVERDLEPMPARLGHEAVEVCQVAECRLERRVAAAFVSDCPRAAWIVRPRFEAVVFPLAEGVTDRMNRRQVEHVETHRSNVGQAPRGLR